MVLFGERSLVVAHSVQCNQNDYDHTYQSDEAHEDLICVDVSKEVPDNSVCAIECGGSFHEHIMHSVQLFDLLINF